MRQYTLSDHFCLNADRVWRFLTGYNHPDIHSRDNPAQHLPEPVLSPAETKHIAGLMRINYAGEVCAQALYQGQALTMRNLELKRQLEKAGLEEIDHLYWCQTRLHELNSRVSFLNPLWYIASFMLGLSAGICSQAVNLGFLEETERQVTAHLEAHLQALPEADHKTRTILETMRDEEMQHAETAFHAGAAALPLPVKQLMGFTSKIMTKLAYWV